MKLTCKREPLLSSINTVSKAVSGRTTLPILQCIHLSAESCGLKLTGNDLEIGIQSSYIESQVEETGEVALDAKIFSDIIRKLDGEEVELDTDSRNITKIKCGKSEFKIMGQPGEDFQPIPAVEKENEFEISQAVLKNMIKQTIFSISQDETKPVLTGELFEINNGEINIVSVDGYRISLVKEKLESGAGKISAIVPGRTLSEIYKILLTDENEKAYISFTDKHILFDLGNAIVVSRLIDGEFIKYSQNFVSEWKTRLIINRNAFAQSLERAMLISRDNRKVPVKLEISNNKLNISASSDFGNVSDEIEADTEGNELKIAFNPKYLLDALKAVDDEKVNVDFTTSLSPCIINPISGDSFKYLILPLRM